MSLTAVRHDRYLFSADIVDAGGNLASIAVHWSSIPFAIAETTNIVRDFIEDRVEIDELWFLTPLDVLEHASQILENQEFIDRVSKSGLVIRFYVVEKTGEWTEHLLSREAGEGLSFDPEQQRQVMKCGLRLLFLESEALVYAGAGLHFQHPSGRHSQHFLRASQAASRTQHASFLAAYVLRHLDPTDTPTCFWADTAGILSVLYALSDLQVRYAIRERPAVIDTFEGYGKVEEFNPQAKDLIFISSTTSGGLSKRLFESGAAKLQANVLTLFYLSELCFPEGSGTLLCDLSDRNSDSSLSLRAARVLPPRTYPDPVLEKCELCSEGSMAIELEGDGFLPKPLSLQLRQLGLPSRVQKEKGSEPPPNRHFEDEEYFCDLVGLDAIVPAEPLASHDTTVKISHLLAGEKRNEEIISIVRRHFEEEVMKSPKKPQAIVSLSDVESLKLAEFLSQDVCNGLVANSSMDTWTELEYMSAGSESTRTQILQSLPQNSVVLVCAAAISSGRELLSLNRELRYPTRNHGLRYFIAAAHPESREALTRFGRTLGVQSSSKRYMSAAIWSPVREPRPLEDKDPWRLEADLLSSLDSLGIDLTLEELDAAEDRANRLNDRPSEGWMFCGPYGDPVPSINPKFALWPFEWSDHPRFVDSDKEPTEAEVFATVAHLMAESRLPKKNQTASKSSPANLPRYGVAIDPGDLDRFNDPMIQAAILRNARRGELNYQSDQRVSERMCHVLLHAMSNTDNQGGGAAYEFLLSLSLGCFSSTGLGMRLSPETYISFLENTWRLEEELENGFPHLMSVLLKYLYKKAPIPGSR